MRKYLPNFLVVLLNDQRAQLTQHCFLLQTNLLPV